jgi:enoyl-CoA hydratase/carnithine racemase
VGLGLQSTIAIGASDAVLAFDEIKHGLPPLVVVTYLAGYVGPKFATELVVTGRDVPAPEALSLGLLNRVVPAAQLRATGEELARQLTGYPHSALRLLHTFSDEIKRQTPADQGQYAVDRLAGWIEAGRP